MPRPTKILRIITRLNVGGPTRHVGLLMSRLPAEEFHQVLIHGTAAADEGEGLLPVQGEQRRLPGLVREIRPFGDLGTLARLRRLIREEAPDVVHTHQGKAGLLGRLAASREGVPQIVHTYHGHTFTRYFGALKGALIRRAERRAARASHHIICQSESQRWDVIAALGPDIADRIRIIAPAPDPAAWQLDEGETPASRGEAPVLLFAARLVDIKRPELAAQAFAALRRRRPAVLWVAGEGPLRPRMAERLAKAGVEPDVHWLGAVSNTAPLYAAADAVLLPSAMEGTPQVVLEAMAAGVPVVASDVGGVRDVVGEAGSLLPFAAGPEAWADAVEALLDGEGAARIEAGRQRVREHFSVDRLIAETAALYRERDGRPA